MIGIQKEDAPFLSLVHCAAFPGEGWDPQTFESLLLNPYVLGLREELGFILWQSIEGEGEVLTFAVHPDYQRKGVGRRLLEGCLAQNESVFLEVSSLNHQALALYNSLGFISYALPRKRYYKDGSDALQLKFTLKAGEDRSP